MPSTHGNPFLATEVLADDLLVGAFAIAEYMFGRSDASARRRVYHLAAGGHIRTFKMGALTAARKGELSADLSADRKRGG